MSDEDYRIAIEAGKDIESLLIKCHSGARALSGINEKLNYIQRIYKQQTRSEFPPFLTKDIRYIASIRNKIAHDPYYRKLHAKFNFIYTVNAAKYGLNRISEQIHSTQINWNGHVTDNTQVRILNNKVKCLESELTEMRKRNKTNPETVTRQLGESTVIKQEKRVQRVEMNPDKMQTSYAIPKAREIIRKVINVSNKITPKMVTEIVEVDHEEIKKEMETVSQMIAWFSAKYPEFYNQRRVLFDHLILLLFGSRLLMLISQTCFLFEEANLELTELKMSKQKDKFFRVIALLAQRYKLELTTLIVLYGRELDALHPGNNYKTSSVSFNDVPHLSFINDVAFELCRIFQEDRKKLCIKAKKYGYTYIHDITGNGNDITGYGEMILNTITKFSTVVFLA